MMSEVSISGVQYVARILINITEEATRSARGAPRMAAAQGRRQ